MAIYHAAESLELPPVDLLSLLFDQDSPTCGSKEDSVIHAEAADPSICITKSQARDLLRKVAHGLRHQFSIGSSGPGKDVVVCVSSGQCLLPIMFYAVIAAGGIYSAASPAATATDVARQIKQGRCNLIVCNKDAKDLAVAAARECNIPLDRVILMEPSPCSMKTLEGNLDVVSEEMLEWERITDRKQVDESVILMLYSSGTTGIPKGVLISHTNLVAGAINLGVVGQAYCAEQGFQYSALAHLPAAHVSGALIYFVIIMYAGGPTYWMPKFEFSKFLEYNKQHRITYMLTVPPIYLLIAKSPLVTDHFDSMKVALTAAAPLGKELQHAASMKLGRGKTFISQTWGMTETTGSVTGFSPGVRDDTGSISVLLPGMSMRIVDDDFNDVVPGQPGEFLVKGPVVTKGYYDNPEATKESFTSDGWLCTGDLGLERNGLFYIVDRKKELIKYKGLQVAPAELEALLMSHDQILDAAVIGVDGTGYSEGTEVPRAYIVPAPGGITKEEIMKFVEAKVAQHKKLRGGVVFMDVIPKSPSGKILRKELRALAKKENEGTSSKL
ncbi:hypothetical protein BP6252_01163 [Coleophoma cylindrospora]|uniref:Uncharacterized protein n=1 Tax=Coleophoma cylindrospora TaxID=1849047 RepID=A0A3D8SSH9_9HELO|nr:hypothetical protein BP6252_01163 [Coleophoma cylindrospora]